MINLQDTVKKIKKMQNFHGDIQFAKSMKEHTTFKIGGVAEVFVTPENEESLCVILHELQQSGIEYFILGGGSNIVVGDLGISGFVVSTEKLNNITIKTHNNGSLSVECSAGTSIKDLIEFCIDNELTGLENFAGLPGTVGGALFMNARCYDKSMSDVLTGVRYATQDNYLKCKIYEMNSSDWDYKQSPFQSKNHVSIILAGEFLVTRGKKDKIQEACDAYIKDRENKGHFEKPSAGSVFKNNRSFGQASGQIIDSVGLKGFRIGGAQVAPWHGNLIINLEDASADNIRELVEHVQNTVFHATEKKLECEIIFVGNFINMV